MRLPIVSSFLLLVLTASASGADDSNPFPSGAVIAARMMERDAQRQALVTGYQGIRRYILDNERTHKHAEIVVRVNCGTDGIKHFELVSQNGWKGAYKYVVSKMLASEEEASHSEIKLKTRLSLDNYEFHMVRSALLDDRVAYVVDIHPRRNEERLIKGQVWIDAQDYAVARIEGEPARNPSFWIRSIHFVHTYGKSGPNWFPSSTESVTEVRIFGATTLRIRYFDYTPNLPLSPESARARTEPPGGNTP
jgi:hypothetical protein